MGSWLHVNTSFWEDIIRQLHSWGLSIFPTFLNIIVAFALFHKLAINILIIMTIYYNTNFTYICYTQLQYCLYTLIYI